ncbi:DUF6622 family protein [Rhizobacter fulvus]
MSSQGGRGGAAGSAQCDPSAPNAGFRPSHTRSCTMLIQIVLHTPGWVWGLFAALLALGLSQVRDRALSPLRIAILPLAMVALSLSGVLTAFGHFPLALGGWAAGLGIALTFARSLVAVRGARWLADSQTVHVPGSWLPLALIVALFMIKYAAGVNLAMHPALATDATFAATCSLAYGLFSGLFLARGLGLRAVASQRQGVAAA